MEKILNDLLGKKINVNCGNTAFRGENQGFYEGFLKLSDDSGDSLYIDPTKIVAVGEVVESVSRPGFLG